MLALLIRIDTSIAVTKGPLSLSFEFWSFNGKHSEERMFGISNSFFVTFVDYIFHCKTLEKMILFLKKKIIFYILLILLVLLYINLLTYLVFKIKLNT